MNQGKLKVVKQELARVNVDILGVSELKQTGMGEFKSDDHYIYYCGQGFYEDLQDLLELTPKKDVLFIIGDWNAKVGNQEKPGVTGKFGLGIQNEAGQRLI